IQQVVRNCLELQSYTLSDLGVFEDTHIHRADVITAFCIAGHTLEWSSSKEATCIEIVDDVSDLIDGNGLRGIIRIHELATDNLANACEWSILVAHERPTRVCSCTQQISGIAEIAIKRRSEATNAVGLFVLSWSP